MKLFDTHSHLCCEPLIKNVDEIINTCIAKGILVNNVGIDVETSKVCVGQANKYKNCYAIVGVHPSDVKDPSNEILEIGEIAQHNKVVAIGETGLDFHYPDYDEQKQIESFINHIKLSQKLNLPLVIHTRDAASKTYEVLKNNIKSGQKVLIHCFSGGREELNNYLSLGCYISISGIVTFKKSDELRELVKLIPLDKLLIETDSPYLAPVPHRGKDCMPYFVEYTFNTIAKIFGNNEDELQYKILNNSLKFFNISLK